MEFAKSEPSEQAVFSPEDIALVEHTIGQIDQAKKDQDTLAEAFQEFKSRVSTRGANDLFYSSPANFLTGVMKSAFSPLSPKQIKNDLREFSSESEKLYQKGKVNSDTPADKVALKLEISQKDTPEVFEAKQRLGSAAIILGKYAEKGLYSDIFQKLLVGDSRDERMRAALSTIRRTLRCIFTGKAGKDLDADADPFFQRWAHSPNMENHLYADRYARCREYVQKMYTPGISSEDRENYKNALVKELKIIVGLRHDTASAPNGPHGIIGFTKRHIPALKQNRIISLYAKELIDMSLMQLDYDHALKMAQEEYELALENIDALGLSDHAKAEFEALPDTLFDPERQKKIAATIRNAGKLKKYLFRRNLSRIYGNTNSMDTAISQEMLRAAGAIPDTLYDSADEWLASVRPGEGGSDSLVDLVSSLPDPRAEARSILSEDPDLIRAALGGYKTSDPEVQKKVDDFVNTFEAPTRSELLSKHSPEYRAMNDEIYRFMRSLDGYDSEKGFTPEQKAYLTENGWFSDWFKQNRSTKGYVDHLEEWKKNGADPAKKFDNFKPKKYMLDNLLSVMRNRMLEKRFPADKLLEKNGDLGQDIADLIQGAPSQSRLVSPDWATNKFTARLGRYEFDPDGPKQLEGDLAGDPVQTKITMIYKAFKDQFIATKANVLVDHFAMSQEGEPVEGEVPVENA